jgi:hypothetical protein
LLIPKEIRKVSKRLGLGQMLIAGKNGATKYIEVSEKI